MLKSSEQVKDRFSQLLKARFPYIYIPTWEEDRAVEMIRSVVSDSDKVKTVRKLYVWSLTDGYSCDSKRITKDASQPMKAIEFIQNCEEDAVFVLKDFHVYFTDRARQNDYRIIRKLRDILPLLKNGNFKKNVIFVAPELTIPDEMQKEISVFEYPLPVLDEISECLGDMISENGPKLAIGLTTEGREKMARAALGMTLHEAENAFARAMVNDGKLDDSDISVIHDEKNQVVKKTGILEFVKSDISIDDIGGLDNLKRWLKKRNNTWLDSAKKYNVPAPKGVLITGVPGCGKSLTAKAMSAMWQLPLLKLDMGKIFSGLVGSSEENLRRALRTAEAVAPSILWVDEIEKGLAGVHSTGDSGTASRVFGTFLTWMQDKTAPVFVVATANNISHLPPELLRKGRFDEIFFVDMPTLRERKEIFKLHLNKRLKDQEVSGKVKVSEQLLERLAEITEGFVGAEIEQIVIEALYEAFFEDRALTEEDLEYVIRSTVTLSVTQKEYIRGLREWANLRAVAATSKEDLVSYSNQAADEDIADNRGGRIIDF